MANVNWTVSPSGGDYTSLSAALTAQIGYGGLDSNCGNSSGAGILTITIEGDWSGGADTTACPDINFTTTADYYLVIQCDSANAAGSVWDSDKYVLDGANYDHDIEISTAYVRISGLQILHDGNHNANESGIDAGYIASASDIRIDSCFIRVTSTSSSQNGMELNYNANAGQNGNLRVYNCIVAGVFGSGSYGIRTGANTALKVYNCTIYNFVQGCGDANANVEWKNCAVFSSDAANADDFNCSGTIDYCASDDNDGTNNVAESGGGAAWPSDFNAVGSNDFTLLSGSGLVGNGTDNPSGGYYSDDINGDTRTSSWDVGADEYVAAGGASSATPLIMMLQRRRRIA